MDRLKDVYKGVSFLGEKMIRSGKNEYSEDYKRYLKDCKSKEIEPLDYETFKRFTGK